MATREPLREIILNLHWDIDEKGISAANRRILKRIEGLAGDIDWNFKHLYRHYKGYVPEVAKQAFTIEADDLSTSATVPPVWHSAPNDLLTVKSETEFEFDYRDFWKTGKFVLSPGKGVYHLKVIPALDQVYPDILESESAVYAYGATQLQYVQWNGILARWEAQSWRVGWTVWHWLVGPPGGFE